MNKAQTLDWDTLRERVQKSRYAQFQCHWPLHRLPPSPIFAVCRNRLNRLIKTYL